MFSWTEKRSEKPWNGNQIGHQHHMVKISSKYWSKTVKSNSKDLCFPLCFPWFTLIILLLLQSVYTICSFGLLYLIAMLTILFFIGVLTLCKRPVPVQLCHLRILGPGETLFISQYMAVMTVNILTCIPFRIAANGTTSIFLWFALPKNSLHPSVSLVSRDNFIGILQTGT